MMLEHAIGLYYPFIHFKDDAWLKLVALYWDRMARIVPEGHELRDSETARTLVDETNFIVDVPPDPGDEVVLTETFGTVLRQQEPHLQARYGVAHAHTWPDDPITTADAPPGANPKLAYMHVTKLHIDLFEALSESGLVQPARGQDASWVGMHPRLAFIYMAALAEEMAATRRYHPVTDETLDHLAVSGYTVEHLTRTLLDDLPMTEATPSSQELEATLAMVAVQSVIPKNLAQVSAKEIVAVRKAHANERLAFQAYLHELVGTLGELGEITDREAVAQHLAVEYEKRLRPQLDALKSRLKVFSLETVTSALNVRAVVPPLFTSVGGAALGTLAAANPAMAVAGGVAFGALPLLAKQRRAGREAAAASPAAYLLHLEELQPATLLSWIGGRARRFVFGV